MDLVFKHEASVMTEEPYPTPQTLANVNMPPQIPNPAMLGYQMPLP
jgi:hypothetical protein